MKAQWFHDSYQFSSNELDYLEELRELYPASAPIQVAYLRALAQHRGSLTALEVETCALRIPNRAELHRLISGLVGGEEGAVLPTSGKAAEVKGTSPKEQVAAASLSLSSSEEVATDAGQLAEETVSPGATGEQASISPLEREVLAKASAESYAASLLNEAPVAPPAVNEADEPKRENSTFQTQPPAEKPQPDAQRNEAPVRSFSDWLFTRQNLSPQEDQGEKIAVTEVNEVRDERSLIEQFIRQQPQITPRKPFYSPIEMGKKSLDDSLLPVTETLAMIYMQQSEFKKAADAFKQLALKFPEKSSYFVALEKEAQSRLNETKKK